MVLSILIVHYKTPDLLRACLDSIAMQDLSDFEVIIVDNEANPALPDTVAPYKNTTLIQNEENVGFGRANNQGAAAANGEYLFLLNPDAQLLTSDALSRLLNFARQHPEAGLVGINILDSNHHEESPPQKKYPGLKHYRGSLFKELPGDIAWVSGAGIMIPHKVFNEVQGFDPDFFLYAEEVDLCLRIRKHGYTIDHCAEVAIEHVRGASQTTIDIYNRCLIGHKGLYLFFTKHYPETFWRKRLKRDIRRANRTLLKLWLQCKIGSGQSMTIEWERRRAIKDCALKTLKDPNWLKYQAKTNF